jgi:hypothetical protein
MSADGTQITITTDLSEHDFLVTTGNVPSPTPTPSPTVTPTPTVTPVPSVTPTPSPTVTPTPTATPVPGQGPVTSGLALWYDLGQSGSTLTDKSGSSNTGTVFGTKLVAAAGGQVRYFAGTSADYVKAANKASLNPTGGLTVEALFKLDQTSGLQTIASKSWSSSTGDGYTLWANGNTLQWFVYDRNGNRVSLYSPAITAGKWYHVAATCDGSTMALYLNGVKVASQAYSGLKPSVLDFTIGRTAPRAECFLKGSMATMRIYGRGLSASEVVMNYNADSARVGLPKV